MYAWKFVGMLVNVVAKAAVYVNMYVTNTMQHKNIYALKNTIEKQTLEQKNKE